MLYVYFRFGHYSDEMFRACRLVVDTGIHSLGWTREEAVDFMYTHTAMTKVAVEVRKLHCIINIQMIKFLRISKEK